eukprot:350796-Chlamydomonas_euryale.AAC.7
MALHAKTGQRMRMSDAATTGATAATRLPTPARLALCDGCPAAEAGGGVGVPHPRLRPSPNKCVDTRISRFQRKPCRTNLQTFLLGAVCPYDGFVRPVLLLGCAWQFREQAGAQLGHIL